MKTKVEFFKKYCELKGLSEEFAFGVVSDKGNSIEFVNGESSTHLMWEGKNIKHGQLYKVYKATCSGSCEIGKPAQKCIDNGLVSKTKCAVYSYSEVDLETFQYSFSFEELQTNFPLFGKFAL